MDLQLLQDHLKGVQNHLENFRGRLAASESSYQASLNLTTDAALSSALMERHIILSDRRRTAISRMEAVEIRIQDQIKIFIERNAQ